MLLRQQLCVLTCNHPHARHFVIAHSHGGNVSICAISDSERLNDSIRGIAFFATPFISMSEAPNDYRNTERYVSGMMGILIGLIVDLALRAFLGDRFTNELSFWGFILPFALTLIFMTVKGLPAWHKAADKMLLMNPPKQHLKANHLILRAFGDEVSVTLSTAIFSAFAMRLALNVLGLKQLTR